MAAKTYFLLSVENQEACMSWKQPRAIYDFTKGRFQEHMSEKRNKSKKRKNNFIYDEFTDLLEAHNTGEVNFA